MPACRLIDRKNERRYDDCLKYTMVGSKKALKAAGLDPQVRVMPRAVRGAQLGMLRGRR